MSEAISVKEYRAKVKHDHGTISISTWATDEAAARRIIMAAERCPARSILSVTEA